MYVPLERAMERGVNNPLAIDRHTPHEKKQHPISDLEGSPTPLPLAQHGVQSRLQLQELPPHPLVRLR